VSDHHDDEVLGKAYDARLMRRLMQYLRPYWRYVAAALAAIFIASVAELAQPYLFKVAIDRFISTSQTAGLRGIAGLYLLTLVVSSWANTDRRGRSSGLASASCSTAHGDLRSPPAPGRAYYDRNPVGRLMTA
jgi:ABC-type multidrug transport system fused ATPase/permease subunit